MIRKKAITTNIKKLNTKGEITSILLNQKINILESEKKQVTTSKFTHTNLIEYIKARNSYINDYYLQYKAMYKTIRSERLKTKYNKYMFKKFKYLLSNSQFINNKASNLYNIAYVVVKKTLTRYQKTRQGMYLYSKCKYINSDNQDIKDLKEVVVNSLLNSINKIPFDNIIIKDKNINKKIYKKDKVIKSCKNNLKLRLKSDCKIVNINTIIKTAYTDLNSYLYSLRSVRIDRKRNILLDEIQESTITKIYNIIHCKQDNLIDAMIEKQENTKKIKYQRYLINKVLNNLDIVEKDIIIKIASGKSQREIANSLNRCVSTINERIKKIKQKSCLVYETLDKKIKDILNISL